MDLGGGRVERDPAVGDLLRGLDGAVGQDAVPAELLRNSGSRFDPAVVAACLRALDTPPIAAQGL